MFSGTTGEFLIVFHHNDTMVAEAAFFSDETLAMVNASGDVEAYEVATGSVVMQFACGFSVYCFSVSCTYFAAGVSLHTYRSQD